MKPLFALLLLCLNLQAQVITLQNFKKSSQTSDLSRFEGSRLILETKEQHASGWFYYPQAIKLKGLEKADIEVTVELPSKDACIEIGNSLNPQAKNGFNVEKTFVRLYDTFGDVGGNLYLQHRKNFEPLQGEYLKPFPTGAHSLKMSVSPDSIMLFLLSNGIWQRLKSLENPLPDSFYVAVTASERGKWILAAGQIILTPQPIKPPAPKIVYGEKVTMVWNPVNEPKVRYRAHLGLASRSYPMSWMTPDTFFVFTNVDTGRTYFAAVTAIDSAGNESVYSDEVTFVRRDTTQADPLDLDGDKKVTRADYALLKSNFGKAGKGDFDENGVIDENDLLWFWRFADEQVWSKLTKSGDYAWLDDYKREKYLERFGCDGLRQALLEHKINSDAIASIEKLEQAFAKPVETLRRIKDGSSSKLCCMRRNVKDHGRAD